MKGRVEVIQGNRGEDEKYKISLLLTIAEGLTYPECAEIIKSLRTEYLDREVEIRHHEPPKPPWPL